MKHKVKRINAHPLISGRVSDRHLEGVVLAHRGRTIPVPLAFRIGDELVTTSAYESEDHWPLQACFGFRLIDRAEPAAEVAEDPAEHLPATGLSVFDVLDRQGSSFARMLRLADGSLAGLDADGRLSWLTPDQVLSYRPAGAVTGLRSHYQQHGTWYISSLRPTGASRR